ncbi:NAD(P)-dependent alcohol dehydrogenase [Sediminibacillus albus]|uniref:Aryl-alcohol dehydrogenase n=1 Tax=Sediminibacillus albus TaxID=407036 RepID=A0A1G8X786_9BACI|nr:NAD(P)-dependent alcohol dehydrogenase [Sediminibacillus albus]SDJ86373.1 aryl-alcohol dehydrogenase [Sediminibacillus albus]
MKVKAAVIHDKGEEFQIEEVELGEPNDNEVLVKIVAAGVCHTDAVARDQEVPVPLPAVLGHEGAGIVEKVGSNVQTVEKGDHVVLSFSSCGHCENCLSGHPAYCLSFNDLNFGGKMNDNTNRIEQDGKKVSSFFGQSSFGTFAVANQRNVVKVDKDVDLALLGPLGCGIQTGSGTVLNKLQPKFGETIAVFGCGAVGLSAVMAANIIGCSKIIAIDVHQSRLQMAKELGATDVLNGKEVDVVEEIRRITGGGTNYAVETTSVPALARQSVQALKPLGTSAVVGVTQETEFNVFEDIMALGKGLVGAIEGNSIPQLFIPKLIEYYKKGLFPFDKLVKFYSLKDINQAFEDSKQGTTVKPIVKMDN